ncbi:MAG: ribulokinase [Lachnospiraceae bacterium]|nr:ribulokinase [Lachnospiraceae bacterium]
MKKQYTIGLDFGSLSGRGVLVDTGDGNILAEAEMTYPNGIMSRRLPDGTLLEGHWFLQHPQDYLDVLEYVVHELLKRSNVKTEQIVGIGVDFTASTVLPLDEHMQPLCSQAKFENHPHAWVKLWKHRSAVELAADMARVCREQGLRYPEWHGGRIPSGCLLAKVMQVCEEDDEVYEAADCFMEAADYITSLLAGGPVFSGPFAETKALWSRESGYPDEDFFAAVDPRFKHLPKEKLIDHFPDAVVGYPGERVGNLCEAMAKRLGLCPGIAVTAPLMDAYAAMPAVGICASGRMMMIVGTSTVMMSLSDKENYLRGAASSQPCGYYPGKWNHVFGQPTVGDGLQWFIDNCTPGCVQKAAKENGKGIQEYLTELATEVKPGKSGLLALGWFNGGSSLTGNSRLSALLLGLKLDTKPEEIYRALIEATAYEARMIMETYEKAGISVEEIIACGGIAGKNQLMMQIYADVLGKNVNVSHCGQASALGSAIFAATAAGKETGIQSVIEAVKRMSNQHYHVLRPIPEHQKIYEELYQEYGRLYEYFGHGENGIMERLSDKKQEEGNRC